MPSRIPSNCSSSGGTCTSPQKRFASIELLSSRNLDHGHLCSKCNVEIRMQPNCLVHSIDGDVKTTLLRWYPEIFPCTGFRCEHESSCTRAIPKDTSQMLCLGLLDLLPVLCRFAGSTPFRKPGASGDCDGCTCCRMIMPNGFLLFKTAPWNHSLKFKGCHVWVYFSN